MKRILCPFHEESTPSCVVYHDHYRCYGCNASGPISALGSAVVGSSPVRLPPADLQADVARVSALPRAVVRGLSLPVDDTSYYILWPGNAFYKRRKFFPGDGPKYLCPRGHKKPLYFPRQEDRHDTLAVVEGELNALSLASIEPPFDVCSPGGVGDFKESLWPSLAGYKKYLLILDKDKPGLDAGKKMKEWLVRKTPYVELRLVSPDLNDMLVYGSLKQEVESWAV